MKLTFEDIIVLADIIRKIEAEDAHSLLAIIIQIIENNQKEK